MGVQSCSLLLVLQISLAYKILSALKLQYSAFHYGTINVFSVELEYLRDLLQVFLVILSKFKRINEILIPQKFIDDPCIFF